MARRHAKVGWDPEVGIEIAIEADSIWKEGLESESFLWQLRKLGYEVHIYSYRKKPKKMLKKFWNCPCETIRRFQDEKECGEWVAFMPMTRIFTSNKKHTFGDKGVYAVCWADIMNFIRGDANE